MPVSRALTASAAVAALVTIGGCATTSMTASSRSTAVPGQQLVAEGRADLAGASPCCQDLSQARRRPLPQGRTEFAVGPDSTQVFEFAGSKAFFVLFELPPYAAPYAVRITSLAQGPLGDSAILVPRVALYDESFQLTRSFDERRLRNRGGNLERTLFVNPRNARERYLAVYGADVTSSTERTYSTNPGGGFSLFKLHGGIDGTSVRRSSPVGVLQVETQGLGSAR